MVFSKRDHWVWDFWLADDGETHHLFYLHAPTSLGDPALRHRNASIGHATSSDLTDWEDHGPVLTAGPPGDLDSSATWTGSVVRGDDGRWRMFYTGSVFLSPHEIANVESIGVATSDDLFAWTKEPRLNLQADPRWYELLTDRTWHEEAWRDPWVFRDPAGEGWHMLITARSRDGGDVRDRGVVGHARSSDLSEWIVQPPVSTPGSGFAHVEVPQFVSVDGRDILLFSCDAAHLAGRRSGDTGGVWFTEAPSAAGPFDLASSTLLTPESLYAGRVTTDRSGASVFLAFENVDAAGGFGGRVSDPYDIGWDDARLTLRAREREGERA